MIRIFEHISLDGVIEPGGRNEDSDYAPGGWMASYRSAAGAEAVAKAQGKGFDLLALAFKAARIDDQLA